MRPNPNDARLVRVYGRRTDRSCFATDTGEARPGDERKIDGGAPDGKNGKPRLSVLPSSVSMKA